MELSSRVDSFPMQEPCRTEQRFILSVSSTLGKFFAKLEISAPAPTPNRLRRQRRDQDRQIRQFPTSS